MWQEACNVYPNIVNYHTLSMAKKKIKIINSFQKKIRHKKKEVTTPNIHQNKWNKWLQDEPIVASNFHHKPLTPQMWKFLIYWYVNCNEYCHFLWITKKIVVHFFPPSSLIDYNPQSFFNQHHYQHHYRHVFLSFDVYSFLVPRMVEDWRKEKDLHIFMQL